MKLIFEDKIISWLDSFDIFDEIGRKLFRVVSKGDGSRLKVYDSYLHNKSVATIRKNPDGGDGVEIKHGTRFVAIVKKVILKFRSLFDLGFLHWRAEGNFDDGAFSILDANNRTIASVGETFMNHEIVRYIDTLPEYFLYSLTFTLAIDVQTSETSLPVS